MSSSLIGSLRVALSLGTAEFEAGAAKAATVARTRAKEIEGSFAGAKAAVSGLFAAFAVGALTEQIKKSLDYAGSLAEVSRTLGVTTKDLQTFRFAATQSGVAQDELEVGLRRLTVSMGKAELGSKAQAKAFEAIGISVAQLKGKNTGDVFRLMADGLSKVTDRSQRAAIEMTLMGRSGSTLDNLLAPGSKRLNELAEAAQRLGIVLSDSQIQGAEETAHKLAAVKEVLSAQIAGVVASNASAILGLSSALATLTGSIIKFLGSNPQLALGIIGALVGANIGKVAGGVGALAGAAAGGIGGVALGNKLQQFAADGNSDLGFRRQQLNNSVAALRTAQAAPDAGGRVLPGIGGQASLGGAVNVRAAAAEVHRQADLLRQASAGLLQHSGSAPQGATVPQIFGGGGKKGRTAKAPTDRSDDVEFQFAQEQRQLDLQIIDAKKQLSHDYVEQTTLSIQALDIEKAMRDADIDHKVEKAKQDAAEGKITQSALAQVIADAGIEKAKEGKLDQLKRQALLDERDQQLLQQSIELDQQGYDIMIGELQKQAAMAQTADERLRIELQILDLTYKWRRILDQRIIAENKDPTAVLHAQADLAAIPKDYSLDRQNTLHQNQGPLGQYLLSLPTSAAKWQEALQGVAVDGFGAITNSIDPLVAKIDKLGGVFGDVTRTILSDLLKLELQKLIIAPLANALGGILGGKSIFPVVGGVDPLAAIPARAAGGPVSARMPFLVGEKGPEIFVPAMSGMIIPNSSPSNYGSIAPSGGTSKHVVEVVLRDEMLDARITQGSAVTISRAYPGISAGIQSAIRERGRRRS